MQTLDLGYYSRRAEEERERATTATDPVVAAVHAELARRYTAMCEAAVEHDSPID